MFSTYITKKEANKQKPVARSLKVFTEINWKKDWQVGKWLNNMNKHLIEKETNMAKNPYSWLIRKNYTKMRYHL